VEGDSHVVTEQSDLVALTGLQMWVVLLDLPRLQVCHAGGVAGSARVTHVSRGWCCWLCKGYICVMRVVLLALPGLQMCHAGGVAGSARVTHVSRGWCCWLCQGYTCVTRVEWQGSPECLFSPHQTRLLWKLDKFRFPPFNFTQPNQLPFLGGPMSSTQTAPFGQISSACYHT
jgi:hypothetical protein